MRVIMISLNYPRPNKPSFGIWFKNQIGAYAEYVDLFLYVPIHITPSISIVRRQSTIGSKINNVIYQLKESLRAHFPPFASPVAGRFVRFPSIPPKQIFPYSGGVILAARLCWSLIGKPSFDVIHGQSMLPDGLAAVILGKLFRRPSVVTAIGSDIHSIRKNSITYKTTQFVLRNATVITAVSTELKDRIQQMGISGNRIVVVPNGIDPDFATKYAKIDVQKLMKIPPEAFVFGYVGRLIPVKDPMTLLKAFAKTLNRHRNIYLVFVGDGELRGALCKESHGLGITDKVRFSQGMVSPSEIPSYMQAFNFLCVPSIAEGWPNVILEAMVCGKPVIATNVGGNAEAVCKSEYGLLVPESDPDALSGAMAKALQIRWNKEKIVQYAKSNSWDKVGEQYSRIYRQLKS